MTTKDHPDLPLEQQRNAEYLVRLEKWLITPVHYGVARNDRWVRPGRHANGKDFGVLHPLIGRVGLTVPDETLGSSFYVGARRFDGDTQTVSWLAPVARAFFHPTDSAHGLEGHVAAVRTFSSRSDHIVDLDEEWFVEPDSSLFAAQSITVSAPAKRAPRRRLAATTTTTTTPPVPPVLVPTDHTDNVPAAGGEQSVHRRRGMRGSGAVLKRLSAPRASELVSVLATLQPDQHDLVTRPADSDLIVQGHPGTGKTVVAAYRAGYLVTPHDPERHEYGGGQKRVLLVGPTAGWVKHVSGLVSPFQQADAGRLRVTDLRSFMSTLVGIKSSWAGGIDGDPDDLDGEAVHFVQRAAALVARQGGYSRATKRAHRNLSRTYEMLTRNGFASTPITDDPAAIQWLRKLPSFEVASGLRRYLPLVAHCRLAHQPYTNLFDHVIVDEAQDVTPIEWSLLAKCAHPWDATWTLVGDQNQRRTNLSHTSWQGIVGQLGLGAGKPVEPQVMHRGYRSTNEILTFADRLLGPSLRQAGSVQEPGAPVQRIRETKSKRLYLRAASVAQDLARKHHGGTVALITVYPDKLVEQMTTSGWRRPSENDFRTLALDGASVQVFSPERARGLEFDAVVVIEPRQYDNDNGRHSQLYTSLTRANRELAVVYHQGLPAGLRAP